MTSCSAKNRQGPKKATGTSATFQLRFNTCAHRLLLSLSLFALHEVNDYRYPLAQTETLLITLITARAADETRRQNSLPSIHLLRATDEQGMTERVRGET